MTTVACNNNEFTICQRLGLLIRTLRTTFGPKPLKNARGPSSRATRIIPLIAFAYANLCAGAFAPSAHMRTKTIYEIRENRSTKFLKGGHTSDGFPTRPASPPATPAQPIVADVDSFFFPYVR